MVTVLGALLVGCGSSTHPVSVRVSGESGIGPVLTRADLRSAHADIDPTTSQPIVVLELTPTGQREFVVLTRAIVHAGRRHHRPFHVSISVNGKVVGRPYIDYHRFPNGLPANEGIEINGLSMRASRELAAKLTR